MKNRLLFLGAIMALVSTSWANDNCLSNLGSEDEVGKAQLTQAHYESIIEAYSSKENAWSHGEFRNAVRNRGNYSVYMRGWGAQLSDQTDYYALKGKLQLLDAVRLTRRELGNGVIAEVKSIFLEISEKEQKKASSGHVQHIDIEDRNECFLAEAFSKFKQSSVLRDERLITATNLHDAMICLIDESLVLLSGDNTNAGKRLVKLLKKDKQNITLQKFGASIGQAFLKVLMKGSTRNVEQLISEGAADAKLIPGADKFVSEKCSFIERATLKVFVSKLVDELIERLCEGEFIYEQGYPVGVLTTGWMISSSAESIADSVCDAGGM